MKNRPFFLASGILLFCFANWPFQLGLPDSYRLGRNAAFEQEYQNFCLKIVKDSSLYHEGWDTLAQPNFWRETMDYGPDSMLINIAKTREVVGYMSYERWGRMSKRRQRSFEDSVKRAHGMKSKEELFFTNGRNHFYQFEKVLPEIDRAIRLFEAEGVDPWYAQTILLIESPGRLQFSTDGAYGAFQLMEGVAKEVGLVINDTLDEREDFEKSARGAARLIEKTCIPRARVLVNHWGLPYEEHELWFRLLVMHVYHAGFGNVRRVLRKIRPTEGGPQLIQQIWQTKGRRFGNASQNYSQIALAALLELDELLVHSGFVCPEEGGEVGGQKDSSRSEWQ